LYEVGIVAGAAAGVTAALSPYPMDTLFAAGVALNSFALGRFFDGLGDYRNDPEVKDIRKRNYAETAVDAESHGNLKKAGWYYSRAGQDDESARVKGQIAKSGW